MIYAKKTVTEYKHREYKRVKITLTADSNFYLNEEENRDKITILLSSFDYIGILCLSEELNKDTNQFVNHLNKKGIQ